MRRRDEAMAYSQDSEAGRAVLEAAGIEDVDGTVFKATFRREGKTTDVVVAGVKGVWYIAGHIPVNAPRTFGSLCAFFGRVEVLDITRLQHVR